MRIVTEDNCQVGDKIMYNKEFLDEYPFYKKVVEKNNIVYLQITTKNNFDIRVTLVNHKGFIKRNFVHGIIGSKFFFYE